VAAILHDVVDDTDVDISELEDIFGEQVASMVSKVSQLSQTNQLVRRRLRLEARFVSRIRINVLHCKAIPRIVYASKHVETS
jgi:(p)ppGpp synthase/HD superfamily hydrolase